MATEIDKYSFPLFFLFGVFDILLKLVLSNSLVSLPSNSYSVATGEGERGAGGICCDFLFFSPISSPLHLWVKWSATPTGWMEEKQKFWFTFSVGFQAIILPLLPSQSVHPNFVTHQIIRHRAECPVEIHGRECLFVLFLFSQHFKNNILILMDYATFKYHFWYCKNCFI